MSMITLKGVLNVTVRNGRNGTFSVGELVTPICTFQVKDTILDQYEEGRYEGEFYISKIYPSSYTWRGRVFTEIRATVDEIVLFEAKQEELPKQENTVPDPIEEGFRTSAPPAQEASNKTSKLEMKGDPTADALPIPGDDDLNSLQAVFADDHAVSVQKREAIKLDPTIDRVLFRQQRDTLKSLGYSFDSTMQIWVFKH